MKRKNRKKKQKEGPWCFAMANPPKNGRKYRGMEILHIKTIQRKNEKVAQHQI